MYRVDVLSFGGRLDRLGFALVPIANLLLLAVALSAALLLTRFALPPWAGAHLLAACLTLAVIEAAASSASAQARRLRDLGLSGWHAAWTFALPILLSQAFPAAGAATGVALSLAFVCVPGRRPEP